MEKKGLWLAEHVGEIILAIICLGLLLYGGSVAYTSLFGEQEKMQAQAQLGDLVVTLEQLGPEAEELYPLFAPSGWFLVSFSKGEKGPTACFLESCICICQKKGGIRGIGGSVNCDKGGICETITKDAKLEPKEIGIPAELSLKSNSFFAIKVKERPKLEYSKIKTKPDIEVSYEYKLKSSSRAKEEVNRIILHHTATTSAEETFDVLKQRGLSVHYMIDKNGIVYYMVDEERMAYHAAGKNDISIGIEIVNLGCKEDKYTDAQYESIKMLINDIAKRWPSISVDNEHVIGHFQVTESGKWDPSPNFDWAKIGLPDHVVSTNPPKEGWLTCIA